MSDSRDVIRPKPERTGVTRIPGRPTFESGVHRETAVPIDCQHKIQYGRHTCHAACPMDGTSRVFQFARVERPDDLPPADDRTIDIAVLDMNHGWPNLGHDSLVHAVQDASCDLVPALSRAGLVVRVLSFDVRRAGSIPERPNGRLKLYLGTGGPGHLDPRRNDGIGPESQGVKEDPAWEAPVFRLFDAIREDPEAALLAVCHTFGVMCRWLGIARPVWRGPEKGGKSAGVVDNVLTPEAFEHPWFAAFARTLPDGRHLRILDSRLYDLIPEGPLSAHDVLPIGYETRGIGGPQGEALTMMEVERDREGGMPRVFGVNHHPEIVNRARMLAVLRRKYERGDVSRRWFEERLDALVQTYPDEDSDQRLHLTSDFTILGPIRFWVWRLARQRAERLGSPFEFHEASVPAMTVAAAEAMRLAGGRNDEPPAGDLPVD